MTIHRTIEIRPGRSIHVDVAETKSHTATNLFCLHGLGGRAEQWFPLSHHLQHFGNVIIPDLYGHGKSPKPFAHRRYYLDALYQDIEALFTQNADEKNVIVAHSLGVIFALRLAMDFPSKITKLIFISPIIAKPQKKFSNVFRLPLWALSMARTKIEESFFDKSFPDEANPEVVAHELSESRKNVLHVIKPIVNDMRRMPAIDVTQINVPTLVILGLEDKLTPSDMIKRFYEKMPHVTIEEVPYVGHFAMLEKTYVVDALVDKFLGNQNHDNVHDTHT